MWIDFSHNSLLTYLIVITHAYFFYNFIIRNCPTTSGNINIVNGNPTHIASEQKPVINLWLTDLHSLKPRHTKVASRSMVYHVNH